MQYLRYIKIHFNIEFNEYLSSNSKPRCLKSNKPSSLSLLPLIGKQKAYFASSSIPFNYNHLKLPLKKKKKSTERLGKHSSLPGCFLIWISVVKHIFLQKERKKSPIFFFPYTNSPSEIKAI